jgi:hypothetical protein
MSRSAIVAVIIFLLAASFASAASIFKAPAGADEDFCFGYAICE